MIFELLGFDLVYLRNNKAELKLTNSEDRFKNAYQTLVYDFIKDVLVHCPNCENQAIVKNPIAGVRQPNEYEVRLVCTHCGYSKILSEKPDFLLYKSRNKALVGKLFVVGGSVDPFFQLPLWLTKNIDGNLLWAYNFEHLDFIENHIKAKLRERNGLENRNKSLGSRLPKWMTSKKNRESVLLAIEKLRNK